MIFAQPKTQSITDETEQKRAPPIWKNRKFIYSAVIFAIALALLTSYYLSNKKTEKLKADSDENAKNIAKEILNKSQETDKEETAVASEKELLDLAKRLKKHDIKVYGVTPCGWTKRQRDMFGSRESQARKLMESLYTECRSPDDCPDIMGYPTWKHGEKSFPGFKTVEDLESMIEEVKKSKKSATAPKVVKKRVEVMEVIEEIEESDSDEVEPLPESSGVTIEELPEEPEAEGETLQEESIHESEEETSATPPPSPKPVIKKRRTLKKKSRVEHARGVSEYAPLAIPDMPGTGVFEPDVSRTQEQTDQGNIPRQALENPDPVADIANQFTQSYQQVAADELRSTKTAAVNEAKLPQSATISTGDALQDKRLPIKKRSSKK